VRNQFGHHVGAVPQVPLQDAVQAGWLKSASARLTRPAQQPDKCATVQQSLHASALFAGEIVLGFQFG
jgi:hypothetical protein